LLPSITGNSDVPPSQLELFLVRRGLARSPAAFAAVGLTAAAIAVALGPHAPADSSVLADPVVTVLVPRVTAPVAPPGSTRAMRSASAIDEASDLAQHDGELNELSELSAERDAAIERAGDASALLETMKTARAGAVEQATRAAERARIASAPPREVGQILAAERGFTGEQWSCLDSLWQRESNWNPSAQNRSSGAYGIPQALPGSKMATVAGDWRTNVSTQITWGLNYIVDRYGSPCGAWGHSQGYGWY
jgi:hypothetical protein